MDGDGGERVTRIGDGLVVGRLYVYSFACEEQICFLSFSRIWSLYEAV